MHERILEEAKRIEVEGNGRGGYTIKIGPRLVLLLILGAVGLGIGAQYQLRELRREVGSIAELQEAQSVELGEIKKRLPPVTTGSEAKGG